MRERSWRPVSPSGSWENAQAGYTITGGTVTATTVVDPRGNVTTTRFNNRGYPLTTSDAVGQAGTTVRNTANQAASSTDALDRTTQCTPKGSGLAIIHFPWYGLAPWHGPYASNTLGRSIM